MISSTFEDWRHRLQSYCAQLLGNQHDAEEVVQDVFAQLIAAADRYDLARDPEVLLFRLARHRCIDRRRRRSPTNNVDLEPAAPDRRADAELHEALARLPAAERETLLLTAVDGLGYREAAKILGCSLGTVATRRGAALRRLRDLMEP
ncbi:MAG: RNA polymerase sigma factor [Planctomycetota bacterium]